MKILNILLLAATLFSCDKKQTPGIIPVTSSKPVITDTTTITYLALGDSYTIGEAVLPMYNFPNLLKAQLVVDGYNVAQPLIIARTGWTTDELMQDIKQRNLTGTYGIVTLLIGVNNQYRGYPISQYRTEFAELLNTALAFAGNDNKRVFVLSIPDYGVTPFAAGLDKDKIANELNEYNTINRYESEKAGVSYTDITPISRNAAGDPALIAEDGLHPSAKMYTQWVSLLKPKVAARLSNR